MKQLAILISQFFALLCAAQSACCMKPDKAFASLASDPAFAKAHAEPLPFVLQEKTGREITFRTNERDGRAYFLEKKGSDVYVLVFHEWWGLNDHIRRESERIYSEMGTVNVLAVDLYDGRVATVRDSASKYSGSMSGPRGEEIIRGAMAFCGKSARFATIGWCFGGGWSIRASIMASENSKACVAFYGAPETDPDKLRPLRAPVLFIWASQDKWINAKMVGDFEAAMLREKKALVLKKYNADHGFANPSHPNFRDALAQEAFGEAFKFLKEQLRQ
jgi:carboxymethylenebutenolidase